QRYNVKVQLRHSWYGGITALVLLPPSVTVQAPVPEALPAAHNGGHQWPELAPPTRPSSDGAGRRAPPPPAAAAAAEGRGSPPPRTPRAAVGAEGDGRGGEQPLPIFEAARS